MAGEARAVMNYLWIIQYWSRRRKSELSSDWHTKGFGRTSDTVGIRQPMERRTDECKGDEWAAGGDLKTSGKKVTSKGQVKPFASTFFNIERNFWWGQSSELRWTNAEGKRHVVHFCDVTWLGWWLLTWRTSVHRNNFMHTDTQNRWAAHHNNPSSIHTLVFVSFRTQNASVSFLLLDQILKSKIYSLTNRC